MCGYVKCGRSCQTRLKKINNNGPSQKKRDDRRIMIHKCTSGTTTTALKVSILHGQTAKSDGAYALCQLNSGSPANTTCSTGDDGDSSAMNHRMYIGVNRGQDLDPSVGRRAMKDGSERGWSTVKRHGRVCAVRGWLPLKSLLYSVWCQYMALDGANGLSGPGDKGAGTHKDSIERS